MNLRAAFAVALGVFAAAGCSTDPPPAESFYELTAGDSGRRFGEPLLDGTLVVERFAADGVVGERPILYKAAEGPRLQQYSYHYWSQTPGALLRDAAIREYRRAGAASRVAAPGARLLPDYRMTGTLERLYHRRSDGQAAAVLAVEVTVTRARDGEPLLLKRYSEAQRVRSTRVQAAVQAFRTAITTILARSMDDLARRLGR